MTILAVGACMVIAAVARANWTGRAFSVPLLKLGQRSYGVTRAYVCVFRFLVFVIGKPMRGVPVLFIAVILVSALLGEHVRFCGLMSRWLRM